MADKASLKIADQPAISDDDPFAELTKIMGFDPRQPVKPTVAEAVTVPVAESKPVEAVPVKPAEAVAAKPVAAEAPAKPIESKPADVAPAKSVAAVDLKPAGPTPAESAEATEEKAAPVKAPATPIEVKSAETAPAKPAETVAAKPATAEVAPDRSVMVVESQPVQAAPAKQPTVMEAQPAMAPAAMTLAGDAFGDVDLGIDLERELMGDLADDLQPPPSIAAASPQATVDRQFAAAAAVVAVATAPAIARAEMPRPTETEAEAKPAAHAAAADEAAAKAVEAGKDEAENLPLAEAEIAATADDAAVEQPVFDDFDDAVAAEMQRSLQQVADADEEQFADAAEPADAREASAAVQQVASADFDLRDLDPADDVADAEEPAVADLAAEDENTEAATEDETSRSASEWELDDVFDQAIAEAPNNVAAPATDRAAAARDDAEVLPPAIAVLRQMQAPVRQREAAPIETPAAEADEIALDASLEDELNALLGNVEPVKKAGHADVWPEPTAPRAAVSQDDIDDEWEPLEPVAPVLPLGRPLSSAAKAGPAVGGHGAALPIDPANQPRHNQPSNIAPIVEAPADDLDSLFDDHAFEAAITNAVAQADWDAEPARPVGAATNEPEEFMPRDGHDPYAALAALSASLNTQPVPAAEPEQSRFADGHYGYRPAGAARLAAQPEAPEIETVDVPEQAVALADDLDLPELSFDDEPAPASHYDDLDAEFTSLLDDMNASAHEPSARAAAPDDRETRYDDAYFDRLAPVAAGAAAAAIAARPVYADGYDAAYTDAGRSVGRGANAAQDPALADMEFAYDPDFDEEIAGPAYAPIAARPKPRRGLLIASVVGGVALLGGVAAFALSFGDGNDSTELALVKADPSPVKVKPENPGGTVIPNQDSKVYDSVAGAQAPAEPAQEKLLSSAEEPIEMPMPDDEPIEPSMSSTDEGTNGEPAEAAAEPSMPAGKATDRIEQVIAEPGVDESVEVAAVAPRKVRTMIVKADGTLVAREEPAPVAANPVESASEGIVDPVASTATPVAGDAETTSTVPTTAAAETSTAKPTAAVAQPPVEAMQAPAAAEATEPQPRNTNGTTPSRAPIAPTRPSDQPVDIVGEVKAESVAALAPAAAAASGAWSMQIASQPTEAAAQSSYQDLLRRYGGVLNGRQATIVKAEITGKGTFWRVRVPAGSRNDAIKLCESYKAAGGNCFVSK